MSISTLLASDSATAYSLYTTNGSSGAKSPASSSNSALLTAFDQALSTTSGSAALSSKSSTAGSPVAQDLQSFVQDLFNVLHQASSTHTKSSVSVGRPVTTPTAVKSTTSSTPAPKAPIIITPHVNASASATLASADASASKTTDSTTATSTTATAATATGTASSSASTQSGTAAFKAFLTTFVQDLQSGGATSGKLVNTKA